MRRSLVLLALVVATLASPPASAQPEIDLEVTVGIDTGVETCPLDEFVVVPAGTTVRICYEGENTGTGALTVHDLIDSELGALLTDFPYSLGEGSSAFLTQTVAVSETTPFTGTWTARTDDDVEVSDEDTAFAIVPEADAGLGACAAVLAVALVRRRRS